MENVEKLAMFLKTLWCSFYIEPVFLLVHVSIVNIANAQRLSLIFIMFFHSVIELTF
jgi:hypothetical protein